MHTELAPAKVRLSDELGHLPEGNRFANALKFRQLGEGGGDVLFECWGNAVRAYAAEQVAAERERWRAEIEPFLVAAADGSMSRNNSEALAGEMLVWVRKASRRKPGTSEPVT